MWQRNRKKLTSDLSKAKFLSVLCDSSTDSSVKENEAIHAMYFNPTLEGPHSVKVCSQFLEMNHLKHQTASGLTTALEKSFKSIEIEIKNKLIGFTSNSASVNRNDKNSVKTTLREDSPWLVFIWCIAHRLELAISDASNGTIFNTIDEMILRFYYLYQKASKKLYIKIHLIREIYKDQFDKQSQNCNPKKHRVRAG